MHPKIVTLGTHTETRLRISEVYDWFVESINANGGAYKVPCLSEISPRFNITGSTLGTYLKQLVKMNLLVVDKTSSTWRYATYCLPQLEKEQEAKIEEPIIEKVIEVETEKEYEEPRVEPIDDFKPLATLELDGWEVVDEKGEKWVRGRELAIHLGYAKQDAVNKIYNEHKGFFKDGIDTATLKLGATDGKEYKTRVFSFTGGLKICRYSEMPKADEVMQQLIDLGDKVRRGEYPAKVSQIDEHIIAWSDKWQKILLGDILHPKFEQIDANITEIKQTVDVTQHQIEDTIYKVDTKIADITSKVDNLVNQTTVNDRQCVLDRYRKIVIWLRYWELGYDYQIDKKQFGDVSRSLCWKIKVDYDLPDKLPVTQIPSHKQERILQDLRKSVFYRLEQKQPKDFYRLEEQYQKFLIEQGFPVFDVSTK